LSFGRRSVANVNADGEHQNSIVDPAVGYVNSHVVERKHSPIPKRNSLPTLDFLGPGSSTVRLKFHQKTTIKNNNNNVKTNKMGTSR
jgi:hypothetical protein